MTQEPGISKDRIAGAKQSEASTAGNGHSAGKEPALKFEISEEARSNTRIRVVGVGGGGSNAVARMLTKDLKGVEFHVLNTDAQALAASPVPSRLAIGERITNGLGAGSDPAVGREAALEDTERIVEILEGANMVFVAAGLGGGTGTGAAPVVASLAKELNALTVAIVTLPFSFEGKQRARIAQQGLAELANAVDAVITIPNDKLLTQAPQDATLAEAFALADDVLLQAVQGISDIICTPGLINRDFADVRATMLNMGHAMMGTATARGPNAATEAARKALQNPLLDEGGIAGARAVLINVTASQSLGLHDINEACRLITEAVGEEEARVSFGVVLNPEMGDEVKVTVIATGFRKASLPEPHYQRATLADALEKKERPAGKVAMAAAAAAGGNGTAATLAAPFPAEEPPAPPAAPPVFAEPLSVSPAGATPAPPSGDDDLDVPAFLRRGRSL